MNGECCGTCRFYNPDPYSDGDPAGSLQVGECHRHAPRAFNAVEGGSHSKEANWPLVPSDEWCGEYQAVRNPAAVSAN